MQLHGLCKFALKVKPVFHTCIRYNAWANNYQNLLKVCFTDAFILGKGQLYSNDGSCVKKKSVFEEKSFLIYLNLLYAESYEFLFKSLEFEIAHHFAGASSVKQNPLHHMIYSHIPPTLGWSQFRLWQSCWEFLFFCYLYFPRMLEPFGMLDDSKCEVWPLKLSHRLKLFHFISLSALLNGFIIFCLMHRLV